jgi:hypothetical protein
VSTYVQRLRARSAADAARTVVRHPASWLAGMVVVATVFGIGYVLKIKGYFVMPDELTYERNALHIAQTGRPVFSSDPYYNSLSQLAALLLAPAWAIFGSIGNALDASHIINVVVFASACVPVYLLARRIGVPTAGALLAGAATVAAPWSVLTGTLMTEPIAYTAFCWGLLGVHRAASEPGWRGDVLGLLAVALAVAARSQLVFLAAVLVAAVVVTEAFVARADPLAAVRRHVVLLSVIAVGLVYVVVTGTTLRDTIGYYDITTQGDILPAGTFAYARELVTGATLASAALPLPLAIAWALDALGRPGERNAFAGAVILLLSGILLAVVAGAFSVRFTSGQNDRYISYLAPVLFTGAAAALTLRPLRLVPLAIATAASVWLLWTSTLALQGPSLVSPGSTFRTVIDGRTRQLATHLGFDHPKPTAVVGVLVIVAVVALAIALRRLPRAAVAAVVGAAILVYGIAETAYSLRKVEATQAGMQGAYAAGRGWADRALPDGQELNVLTGFVHDVATSTAVWWDSVFYDTSVKRVYEVIGTTPYEQPSFISVPVDPRTGALEGLPGGYLLAPMHPVQIGLRGAQTVASAGEVSLMRVPENPRATFILDAHEGHGILDPGTATPLRLFGDGRGGRQPLDITAVAHAQPLGVSALGPDGRRLGAWTLAPEQPTVLRVTAPVPAQGATPLRIRVGTPAGGVTKGTTLQVLGIKLGR